MRAFLVFILPWLLVIGLVVALVCVGGYQTSEGKLIIYGVLCIGAVTIIATPFVIRRLNRQAKASQEALMNDLYQRHRERQEGSPSDD